MLSGPVPMEKGEILDGKYRIGPKIGEGSLGRVYEAEHTTLVRTAAVKMFRGDLIAHVGGAERFLADARAAWKVRHRNIVDVYEFGRFGEHVVYLAMERIEGPSLQAYLEENGKLPWSRVRGIALQVVAALKAAHRRRVLHRGLKATNCFVLDEDDEEPRIKVGDFATVRTGTAKLDPGADQTSVFLGDPAYAAPELNANAEPSARSDVYAVGVLLYRMLTGELPFTGNTPFQVLVGHAEAPVPPPRDKVPSIPEEVEAIILRALAKESSERFESARELALALEEIPPEIGEPEEEDVPGASLEDKKTGEHRQAETSSRDEAMHAAFERQSMDDGEPEATSMFARQQLISYSGPAVQDLQAGPRPPPSPPQVIRDQDPQRPGNASALVPPVRGPLAAPEGTVLLPGGGVSPPSPRTVPLKASVLRETGREATAVFERSARAALVESTERLDSLNEPPPAALTERVAGLVRSEVGESAPEGTVRVPAGGVPVTVARHPVTQPALLRNVAPSIPIVASPSVAPSVPSRLPDRATSTSSATISSKHVMIGIAAAIVGTLVGLGLACPARAVVEHPAASKGVRLLSNTTSKTGASTIHD